MQAGTEEVGKALRENHVHTTVGRQTKISAGKRGKSEHMKAMGSQVRMTGRGNMDTGAEGEQEWWGLCQLHPLKE